MNILQALDDPKVFRPFFKGDSWSAWRVFERPGNDLTPQRKWDKEILPKLRRLAEKKMAAYRELIARTEAVLARNPPKTLPPAMANMVKLSRLNRFLDRGAFSGWPNMQIDEENNTLEADGGTGRIYTIDLKDGHIIKSILGK